MKSLIGARLPFAIILMIIASLNHRTLGADDATKTDKWFVEQGERRKFTEMEIDQFKRSGVNALHLSQQVREDLARLEIKSVESVELSNLEMESIARAIKTNNTYQINENPPVGRQHRGKLTSFAFGKIGQTKIVVVGFVFDGSQSDFHLIETRQSHWSVWGAGVKIIDRGPLMRKEN